MLRRVLGIAVKELRQLRRDSRTLALLLFLPAMMLSFYGYALSFDVKHIRLAVLDRDGTQASRAFLDGFFHSEYFDLAGVLPDEAEADDWLDRGWAAAVLIVPRGFGAGLGADASVPVQVLVDGANANSASLTVGYVDARTQQYAVARATAALRQRGIELRAAPVRLEPRIWYNPTLETSQFLVPGLIGYLMMLVAALSTSMSVVREKERNTMEQIVVSAVRPAEFILGKSLPYLAIGLATETLIVLAAMALFDMPFRGSALWLGAASLVFLLGALGVGLLISTIADTQQVAIQITVLATMLPSLILSDLIFPIRSMPPALQLLTWAMPPRHIIVILRSVILKGMGVEAWTRELLFLVGFAVVVLAVASLRLSRRMRRA